MSWMLYSFWREKCPSILLIMDTNRTLMHLLKTKMEIKKESVSGPELLSCFILFSAMTAGRCLLSKWFGKHFMKTWTSWMRTALSDLSHRNENNKGTKQWNTTAGQNRGMWNIFWCWKLRLSFPQSISEASKFPEARSLCEIWTMNYPKEIRNKGHIIWCSNRERDNSPLSCVMYFSGGVVKMLSKYTAHCVFRWRTHICFPPVKLEVLA